MVMDVDFEVGGSRDDAKGWWDRQQMEHLQNPATTRNVHSRASEPSQRNLQREKRYINCRSWQGVRNRKH